MDLKNIEFIVNTLTTDFLDHTWNEKVDASLYTGTIGVSLQHALLYKYTGISDHKDHVYQLVSQSLNNLQSLNGKSSLSGYAGIVWGLVYLTKLELFEYKDIEEYLQHLVTLIIKSIDIDIKQGNYDLMHGLIGKLIAIISVHDIAPQAFPNLSNIIEQSIINLMSLGQESKTGVFWQSHLRAKGIINIGMAHGISSVIWFLTSILDKGFLNEVTKKSCIRQIKKACNWLILQKDDSLHPYFSLPCEVSTGEHKAHLRFSLAWCHGDLGASIALIKAGTALKQQILIDEGVAIAQQLAQLLLKDSTILQDNENVDSSLCHGSLGAFFIFYQLYWQTNNETFKKAYQYWLTTIIDSIKLNEKFMGFKTAYNQNNQNIIWRHNPGLLNGVSGNTLILLTYLMQEQGDELNHSWFDIFL